MKELEYLKNIKLLRISNREQYLVKQPHYHPSTKTYKQFKIDEIKKCLYGVWGREKEGYRWMPPFGYFYANYVWIKRDNEDKEEIADKPSFDDLEWMIFYMFTECYGFSGFELDDEYSCDRALIDQYEMILAENSEKRYKALFNKNGELKKYKKPQDYLYELKPFNMGNPLWNNECKDCIILGSRGAGKSYVMIGLSLWFMCFDGAKSLSKEFIEMRISANVVFGSADSTSHQAFLTKIGEAMNYLLTEPELGVYKVKGLNPITLLGRHMLGLPHSNWRYRYIQNGVESGGTGTAFISVTYSLNKKGGGTTSAAGQRVHLSIVDEVGKLPVSAIGIWGSNRALTRRSRKFGVQVFAGTSGNMELVQEAKKMFQNPNDFDMVTYNNIYENESEEIGFFIPAYLTKRDFKDKDGNTRVSECVDYFLQELKKYNTFEAQNEQKMNYPLIPSHMWITKATSFLPKEEAKVVKRKLLEGDAYKRKRTFVNLVWNHSKVNSVDYKIITEENAVKLDSFRETQGSNSKKNRDNKSTITDTIIYEFPEADAPKDLYKFIGIDPYVSDELVGGESLGSCFILKNPKYISEGISGDIIVAEITGKYEDRQEFNERIEKLLALYGNPPRSLMFEKDRGDDLKEFFIKKRKENLLALSPVKFEDNKASIAARKRPRLEYGFSHGNQLGKAHNMKQFREWLLEDTTIDGVTMKNIERIPSIGLLDEIIEYDWTDDVEKKANYDRISAFIGCIIARRENYNQLTKTDETLNISKKGKLAFLAKTPGITKMQTKWLNS